MEAHQTSHPDRNELLAIIDTLRTYSKGGDTPQDIPYLTHAQSDVLANPAVGPAQLRSWLCNHNVGIVRLPFVMPAEAESLCQNIWRGLTSLLDARSA